MKAEEIRAILLDVKMHFSVENGRKSGEKTRRAGAWWLDGDKHCSICEEGTDLEVREIGRELSAYEAASMALDWVNTAPTPERNKEWLDWEKEREKKSA